ncbi:MAG TPA: glycosyltransferase family 4 protein [Candidatus Dormibacteraeota bacterium]|nr:glycosyltransferase family 4 protein [Candidatus Dormibacteraeota bacterium]
MGDDEWSSWLRTPDVTPAQVRLSQIVARPAGVAAGWLWHRTLGRADAITVEADANVPIGTRDVAVIPPGIDVVQFQPRTTIQPVPGRIVAVGRLISRKGYDVLIRAVAHVVRTNRTAHLLLVGSGPQEQSLKLLVDQLEIGDSVTFTGNIPRCDLPAMLHSAEIFCHPASSDNVPFAPLEAMASGLPTVVSSAGALPELVADAGLVHKVGDDEDLARRLVELLANVRLREALGTAARTRILEHYTWQLMCDRYIDLYQQLFRNKGSRRT